MLAWQGNGMCGFVHQLAVRCRAAGSHMDRERHLMRSWNRGMKNLKSRTKFSHSVPAGLFQGSILWENKPIRDQKESSQSREQKKTTNTQFYILNIKVLTCLSVEQSELGVVWAEDAAAHDLQLVHSESVVSFGVLQQNHTLWSGKQGKKYYRYYIILVVVILTCPSHTKPGKRSVGSIYLSGLGY